MNRGCNNRRKTSSRLREHGASTVWSRDRDLRKFRGITVMGRFRGSIRQGSNTCTLPVNRRGATGAGVPACGVADPSDDPVLVRRARISRMVTMAQRIGYSLWLVAIVVFVIGATTEFRPAMVTIVVGCLLAGSALLAPSIVIGYGVRAADRVDRGGEVGH